MLLLVLLAAFVVSGRQWPKVEKRGHLQLNERGFDGPFGSGRPQIGKSNFGMQFEGILAWTMLACLINRQKKAKLIHFSSLMSPY